MLRWWVVPGSAPSGRRELVDLGSSWWEVKEAVGELEGALDSVESLVSAKIPRGSDGAVGQPRAAAVGVEKTKGKDKHCWRRHVCNVRTGLLHKRHPAADGRAACGWAFDLTAHAFKDSLAGIGK